MIALKPENVEIRKKLKEELKDKEELEREDLEKILQNPGN